jgi:hypothetical protein
MSNKLKMTLSVFKHGERVKIVGRSEDPNRIYQIKKISKSQTGIILYLLESETDFISHLYCETEYSALERLTIMN